MWEYILHHLFKVSEEETNLLYCFPEILVYCVKLTKNNKICINFSRYLQNIKAVILSQYRVGIVK